VLINSAKGTEDGQEQEHAHDDLDTKPRGQPRDLDRFADTAGANGVALPTVDRAVAQQLLGEPAGVYVLAGGDGRAREPTPLRKLADAPGWDRLFNPGRLQWLPGLHYFGGIVAVPITQGVRS